MSEPILISGKQAAAMMDICPTTFTEYARKRGFKQLGRNTVRNRKGETYQVAGWLPWQVALIWRMRQAMLAEIERWRNEIPREEVKRLVLDGYSDKMIGRELGVSHGRVAHVRGMLGLTGNPDARRRNVRCDSLRLDGEPVGSGAVTGFSHSQHVARQGVYTCLKRPRTVLREDWVCDICTSSRCQSCPWVQGIDRD